MNPCFSFCTFPLHFPPFKQVAGSVLPCLVGEGGVCGRKLPALHFSFRILCPQSLNWLETFCANCLWKQKKVRMLLGTTKAESSFNSDKRGEKGRYLHSLRQRREGSSLANVPERRGYESPSLAKDPLFPIRSDAAQPPSLRTTWIWSMNRLSALELSPHSLNFPPAPPFVFVQPALD